MIEQNAEESFHSEDPNDHDSLMHDDHSDQELSDEFDLDKPKKIKVRDDGQQLKKERN